MKKRVFLWVQAALYIILAAMLSLAIVRMYREGAAARAADPAALIFTREKAEHMLLMYLPLILGAGAMTVVGWILRIRDEKQNRPAAAADTSSCLPEERMSAGTRRAVWLVLTAAAVVCIFAGIRNGSMQDVLYKAVNICTECIGLG